MLEEQIKLLYNTIYYPKTENLGFDNFELKREQDNLKLKIKNSEKSFKTYLNHKTAKLIDNNGIFSRSLIDHQSQIDEVTAQNLYNYWEEKIVNNTPIIFIMGNIDKQEITSVIKNYL